MAVTRPETPSQLYLVDDLGNVYEMDKESQNETDYSFRTSAADLAGIGDHFKVAEKIIIINLIIPVWYGDIQTIRSRL